MLRPYSRRFLLPLFACLANAASAASYFYGAWELGSDDENPAPFTYEAWGTNNAPGSPTIKDDDYYLAGTYPGVGVVAANEALANFEQSFSTNDPKNRIHFPLNSAQAASTARLKLTIDLIWGGSATPGFATHDITVTMNGQPVGVANGINWNRTLAFTVPASAVNAVAGPNVIEIHRTGGTSGGAVSLDFLKLDFDPTGQTDADGDLLPLWYEDAFGLNDANPADAAADPDGDQRSTLLEFQGGTNPTDADTDNDGISDSEELSVGTNPLLRDTDGDGISDRDESNPNPLLNTSPLLADTDNDGHPDNIEIEQGSYPNSAASVPFNFPGAIGLQFVSEALQSAALPPGDPAGLFRLHKWNVTPGLPQWQSDGVVLNGSMPLKNHRGETIGAAASWTYHFADEGLHKGVSNERLFNGMLRTQKTGTVNSNGVVTVSHNTPVTLALTGIPYPTYDLIVYTGYVYPNSEAILTRQGDPAGPRYLLSASNPPFTGFHEVTSTAGYQAGNHVRYRGLTGGSQNLTLVSQGTPPPPAPGPGGAVTTEHYGFYAGLHGIQIIDTATDTDGDGLKDAIEVEHRLNPAFSDASANPDGDGLTHAQEIAAGCDPHRPDTDHDGLKDGIDAYPLDPDYDNDTLADGDEVNSLPFPSLPNDADSDDDGYNDAIERTFGTNPMAASSVPPPVPQWDAGTRTWTWRIDNIRLLWNHPQSMLGAIPANDTMLCEAVAQIGQGGWNKSIGLGLRYTNGKLTHRFRTGNGTFHVAGQPTWGFWEVDDPPVDRTRDFGFSGFGTADDSKPLRMEFAATRPNAGVNSWNLHFSLLDLTNPGSPVTLVSQAYTGAVAADASLLAGNSNWTNADGIPGAFDVLIESGVDAYLSPGALGMPDADSDGMPDAWESNNAFNPNSASDAGLDADGDGLTNLKEFLAGTLPRDLDGDSDNDGASDSVELHHGSDPLSDASKPAWFDFTGNVADLDGDGLSDAWMLWSGGIPRAPLADDDGDGMSNLAESEAGTDPDDAASKLDLVTWREDGDLVLAWSDLPLKSHATETSPSLTGWQSATGLPASSVVGGQRRLVIPANTLPAGKNFYRIEITPRDSDGDGVEDWTEELVLGSSNSSTDTLGQPLVRSNGQLLSGDSATLLDRIQGSSPSAGMPGGITLGAPSPVNASRFLMQSTFGPVPEAIAEVRQLGYEAWIDRQLALPPSFHSPYIRQIRADAAGERIDFTYNYSDLDNFLYGNNATTPFARHAIGAPDQLRQRVAFALSQILVVSRRDANLEEKPEGITNYYDTLVRHALGNYGDLLLDVALHPAMGTYLSHAGNQKADPSIPRYPDENFARELMQLFTIGIWELNPDGSRKLDGNNEPIPTYDNGGITELARVFTGLYYASPYGWGGGGWADDHFTKPMVMYPDRHDFEAKKLPNGFVVPPREETESNGMQDVRDAIDALFRHPNTPPFVCRQLIQFLVTDNPSPAFIQRVQDVFVNDGTGTRGNLGAVVKAILLDPEARLQPLSDSYGKVREPVIRTMHLGRLFKLAESHPDFVWWNWTETYYGFSKQEPTNSPSVFNFYTPVYQAPGEIRSGGMVSPGFQIVDTYSAISFPNLLWEYLHGGFRSSYEWRYPLDYSDTLLLAENPAALVDHVNLLVCAGTMTARTRGILLTALSDPNLAAKERVALALWTAMSSPEGTIQK